MKQADALQAANDAFAAIIEANPSLQVVYETDAQVELSLVFPIQDGLRHQVWLGFQNEDELHFSVGNFWLEWFPCTNPARVQAYIEAVCGFLSGSHRVLEHYLWGKCVKAQLQAPEARNWKTIGTWRRPIGLLPLRYALREVRNA